MNYFIILLTFFNIYYVFYVFTYFNISMNYVFFTFKSFFNTLLTFVESGDS